MANIALVTSDTSHVAAISSKAMLESQGHAVTAFNHVAAGMADFSSFDLIATARFLGSEDGYAAAHANVIASHASGKPLLLGYSGGLAQGGVDVNGLVVALGLASESYFDQPRGLNQYALNPHPILTLAGVSAPASIAVYGTTSYMEEIPAGAAAVGMVLSVESSSQPERRTGLAVEKGTTKLGGGSTPAKVVWFGWFYGNGGYGVNAAPIIGGAITWLLSPSAVIIGSVKDGAGAPLQRVVRAYLRSTGVLVGQTTSELDGSFELFTSCPTDIHFVMALDELSGGKNALVKDWVLPYVG